MLTNYHTHTTFCDGKNYPEEIVKYAIEQGYDAIGFSGHGYTPFDLSYCMTDTNGYIKEIKVLREKYRDKLQIYLGVEEDAFSIVNRRTFDYMIGSLHYVYREGEYFSVDSDAETLKKCLKAFDFDALKLSEAYYSSFCEYISKRKPDIVGHFDLLTKFEETDTDYFLNNRGYLRLAEKYMMEALKNDVIFEVNTGAIARGYRSKPYPCENLLHIIKQEGGRIMLSSDCHRAENLACHFKETKKLLKDIGFEYVYILYDNTFKKDFI